MKRPKEYFPLRMLWLWEVLLLGCAAGVLALFLWMFTPYTVVWYALLVLLGGVYLFFAVCYLPLYFISLRLELTEESLVYAAGVFVEKSRYQKLNSISAVSVWDYPLSGLLSISSLILYAPGSTLMIPMMDQQAAYALLQKLRKK